MSDKQLLQRLQNYILDCGDEPSMKDLSDAVTRVYNAKVAQLNEEKSKRKPSAYNIFVKEQTAILRAQEADKPKEERMSGKEKMAYILAMWKAKQ